MYTIEDISKLAYNGAELKDPLKSELHLYMTLRWIYDLYAADMIDGNEGKELKEKAIKFYSWERKKEAKTYE